MSTELPKDRTPQWTAARKWVEAFVAMAESYGHDAEAKRADGWLAENLDPHPVCAGCGDEVDAFCGWCSGEERS